MYIIFIFTQHVDIERYIALAVTICTILFQTYYFRKITVTKATTDTLLPTTIDDLDSIDSY